MEYDDKKRLVHVEIVPYEEWRLRIRHAHPTVPDAISVQVHLADHEYLLAISPEEATRIAVSLIEAAECVRGEYECGEADAHEDEDDEDGDPDEDGRFHSYDG
jgi:hypothetical protein